MDENIVTEIYNIYKRKDEEKSLIGEKIADRFNIKKSNGKYVTSYGNKTAISIYYMFMDLYSQIEGDKK